MKNVVINFNEFYVENNRKFEKNQIISNFIKIVEDYKRKFPSEKYYILFNKTLEKEIDYTDHLKEVLQRNIDKIINFIIEILLVQSDDNIIVVHNSNYLNVIKQLNLKDESLIITNDFKINALIDDNISVYDWKKEITYCYDYFREKLFIPIVFEKVMILNILSKYVEVNDLLSILRISTDFNDFYKKSKKSDFFSSLDEHYFTIKRDYEKQMRIFNKINYDAIYTTHGKEKHKEYNIWLDILE